MKPARYLILFVIIVAFGLVGFFVYRKLKKDTTPIIIPLINTTSPLETSFSLENAPSESLKGEITQISGEVGWQSRTATDEAKLTSVRQIQQGEKLETKDTGKLVLTFPGVVEIAFSKSTAVNIIQTLPTNFVFSQESGTAEYIKRGSTPVAIRAENLLVQSEGDLSVEINPINGFVTVTLKTGVATLAFNDINFVSHEVNISKGQTYIFNDGMRRGVLE